MACLENAFIANFPDDDGHFGTCCERAIDGLDRVGHAFPITVTGLQHIEIEYRGVIRRTSGRYSKGGW